ncbi:MAG: GET complex subunit get1 [Phylliscum demangeonii]|nr:MAG: GET complex subunit get1 [Phylliscum demangeonii]
MASVLLVVFLVQVFITLANTLNLARLNDALWLLFNRLPVPTPVAVQRQRLLQRELVSLRTQLNATSSQDEFAKWAKLRRQHDKVLADLEQTTASVKSIKASFDGGVLLLRWAATNGLRWLLQLWYAKEAVFWLPHGWAPTYVEWLLAFPRAPRGSVSTQIWWAACVTALQLVGELSAFLSPILFGSGKRQAKGGPQEGPTIASPLPEKAVDASKKEL